MAAMSHQEKPGEGRTVFLAGPFKALVDQDTATMRPFERMRYEALIGYLEARGYTVHNAHRREAWGANFLAPDECTRLDHTEIENCDLFIAFPGFPASPGTHIEIGWASARRKPILLLLEPGGTYAFLVRGLRAVADVSYVEMPDDTTGLEQFAEALLRLEARFGWRRETADHLRR
jgi:nucleoside 2-deoxyribosyltransferase